MTTPDHSPVPEPDPRDEPSDQPPAADETPADAASTPDFDSEQWLEMFLNGDDETPGRDRPAPPDAAPAPGSDRAPGILREMPVGAALPPVTPPVSAPEPPADDAAAPLRDMPAPQDLTAPSPAPETPRADEPDSAALPPEVETPPPAESEAAEVETPPAIEPASAAIEAPAASGSEAGAAPLFPFTAEDAEAAAAFDALFTAEAEAPEASTAPAESRAAPAAPPVEPPPAASVVRAEDWDEDLSPELAAVLFGAASAAPAAAETAPAPPETPSAPEPAAPEAAPAVPAPEAAEAAPAQPGRPVMVTTPEEARSRPIVAGQFTAPPPSAPPQGKVRYVRVEEPLRGGQGQHVRETWKFFGPDYPTLEGRLVKRVENEEFDYADGSWKMTFRRDYSLGRDERTIRLACDREYAERTDYVQRRDAGTNKTVREREQVGLRHAAPLSPDTRGFFSRLFGRGSKPQPSGPKSWRIADDSEMHEARRSGGEAFRLGIFGRY